MEQADILSLFTRCHALKEHGHYTYTSPDKDGNECHGDTYVAKEMLYVRPEVISLLCHELARHSLVKFTTQCVVGPERGGIILSQWVGYFLTQLTGRRIASIYAEKRSPGSGSGAGFCFKPEYGDLITGKNVFIVEDVINTGKTVREVVSLVRAHGGFVSGVGALWNRGNVTADDFGSVPKLFALLNIALPRFSAKDCPLCRDKIPFSTDFGHAEIS